MDLHVRYEGDDDPEKCTAKKLERFGLATLHSTNSATPWGIVLSPFAERAVSPADADVTDTLVAMDLSWDTAEKARFSSPAIRSTTAVRTASPRSRRSPVH